jgi:hypothetical protein
MFACSLMGLEMPLLPENEPEPALAGAESKRDVRQPPSPARDERMADECLGLARETMQPAWAG